MKNVLGILGGMGPVASAEFVRTIYSFHHRGPEQDAPIVLLYSDPTFPDRTNAFLRGSDELLLRSMSEALTRLCEMGATHLVICCVTSHYLLDRLPAALRDRIISLPDVIFDTVLRSERKHLLMCTQGTRQSGLFENHPLWEAARGRVVLPEPLDQQEIHDLIYRLKKNVEVSELLPLVEALLAKYEVDSFIVGCTELHLVARHLAEAGSGAYMAYGCLDPLTIIAESVVQKNIHALASSPLTAQHANRRS
ncbi:MAG TPA: amino acid racemase [Pyrinomonadaceae bacterium]|nr:amino acid racemase [Pyrinomonadaceae bacterium]